MHVMTIYSTASTVQQHHIFKILHTMFKSVILILQDQK